MILSFDSESNVVPDGRYYAQFQSLQASSKNGMTDDDGNIMEDAIVWRFAIHSLWGMPRKSLIKFTPARVSDKNATGRMIEAVSGLPITQEPPFNSQRFVGMWYSVFVKDGRLLDKPAPVFASRISMTDEQVREIYFHEEQASNQLEFPPPEAPASF